MGRIAVLVVTIGALAAGGGSAYGLTQASGSTRASRPVPKACGPSSARTLAGGPSARVYVVANTVYGCAAHTDRRFRLGTTAFCNRAERAGLAAVAGRVAALALTTCGVDTGSTTVQVRRLSDGAVLSAYPAAQAPGPESFTSVSAIVVDAAGAVAWIGRAESVVRHGVSTVVYAADGGPARRLDAGSAIVADSLRLAGTAVSWRHGGERRSAPLV